MISWYARPADFNPRSHKGSDRQWIGNNDGPHNFNPRSHKGSDGLFILNVIPTIVFQSTLPQGERRRKECNRPGSDKISIHAPTRGATRSALVLRWSTRISIHAPTRGATYLRKAVCKTSCRFQSTLPQGERRWTFFPGTFHTAISIHAPTRGATQNNKVSQRAFEFQSTLPQGERRGEDEQKG